MKTGNLYKLTLTIFLALQLFLSAPVALSAGKSKGLGEEEMKLLQDNVNILIKKVYASSLFSPADAEKLVDVINQLNTLTSGSAKDPAIIKMFYDAAYVCKEREYTDDAIQFFKYVNEKFPESPYAARALNEMKKMGVNLQPEAESKPAEE